MTAKELKEAAFCPTGADENGNVIGDYRFTTDGFTAFCKAYSREQREICAEKGREWAGKRVVEPIKNAKSPEI